MYPTGFQGLVNYYAPGFANMIHGGLAESIFPLKNLSWKCAKIDDKKRAGETGKRLALNGLAGVGGAC